MNESNFSKLKNNLEDILNKNLLIEIILPDFYTLKEIINKVKIPEANSLFTLGENSEIRYYPDVIESYENSKKIIELTNKSGIISDKYGNLKIDNTYLISLKLLNFDPNIINVNEEGFIYLREPEFYVTKEKLIFLSSFTGTKQYLEEQYYSPILELNDDLFYSISSDEIILDNEN